MIKGDMHIQYTFKYDQTAWQYYVSRYTLKPWAFGDPFSDLTMGS